MMRSLFSGVAGLQNHQTRMDVIGNNIANVNTIGYKASRVNFEDMLSQTLQGASSATNGRGGTNAMQVGLGSSVASIDTIFTDGSTQSTGKQTDMAISGNGFFILKNGSNQLYTRAGDFDFDSQGNLVVPGTGYQVMGWNATATGAIDSTAEPQAITIPVGKGMPAKASTSITYENNLSAEAAVGATVSASISVFDSNGVSHKVGGTFEKTGPLTWTFVPGVNKGTTTTTSTPPSTSTTTVGAITTDTTTQTMTEITTANFETGDGLPILPANNSTTTKVTTTTTITVTDNSTVPPTITTTTNTSTPTITTTGSVNPYTITFDSTGKYVSTTPTTPFTFDPSAVTGGNAVSITPDFSALTQYAGDSTLQATKTDGYTSGTLQKKTIDGTGTIIGTFSNGQTMNLAQVALATFNNPGGLTKVGDSLYEQSNNSGEKQIGTANSGGRGGISASTLEMSNVDLSQEFSNMIITQRGFQANSKIITTSDEMLEILANLKR